jgi:two-component system cell cycle sensor histidine kinase/response regulator CckA
MERKPLRVLIVEDNEDDALLLIDRLRDGGYEPVFERVETREAMKAALARQEWDCIISDYSMPRFSGLDALAELQSSGIDIPFVLVSGTIGEANAVAAMKAGAMDYLMKDNLARLAPVIERELREAELRRQKKKSEELLQRSEEEFRLITENMADLVAVVDLEGKRLYNSPSYKSLLRDPDALKGTDSFADIHPEDRPRVRQVFQETVKTGIGQRTEYRFMMKDGTVRFVESHGSVIMNEEGKPAKVVVVSRDVTERKKLEEQLLHAQKMESIGTLAGGIAHDVNNVLGIILGYLSLISQRTVEPERYAIAIEAMTTAVQRGAGLVRQLLTFARKTEVVFEPVLPNAAVEEVINMCTHTFPKTISCSMELGTGVPAVIADRNQLHQALLNLCVNARDAMPGGGSVALKTRVAQRAEIRRQHPDAAFDQYVSISVTDTGVGMDTATQARIFEPFFTTKGVGRGTGLGLAMVYGFVNSHRGLIDVKSTPGNGTTFILYLPVSAEGARTLDVRKEATKEVKGGVETILFAEDEEALKELVRTLLEANGYTVLTARDGVEALQVFKAHKDEIALVITDLGLPLLDGWESFKKMREIKPDIPAIVATGYVDALSRSDMLKNGARDVVQKPYVPDKLLRTVRDVLDSVSTGDDVTGAKV